MWACRFVAVEPGIEEVDLPVLLDLPKPRLRVYARETVIAEKFHAMAIAATFKRRNTVVPVEEPEALTMAFANDEAKRRQWAAFVSDLADVPSLDEVVIDLAKFLMPHARRAMARTVNEPAAPGVP